MKRSLVLLLLTLLVGVWVWWFEVRKESKVLSTDEAETMSKSLVGAKKEDIKAFTLSKTGAEAISVEFVNGEWSITSPVQASADETTVNGILWDLEWTEKDETVAAADLTPDRLKSYGLDSPQGAIDVTLKNKTVHLIVGGQNLGGSSVYVRAGNEGPVAIVKKGFADKLGTTLSQIRNKVVMPLVAAQAGFVTLTGKTDVSLEKKEGNWNLVTPYEDHADAERINTLVKDANALTVKEFVSENPEDLAQYGLDAPAATAVFGETAATGKRYAIIVGKEAPDADGKKMVYAAGGGKAVFTLPAQDVDKLFPATSEITSKKLTRFDPFMLKKATVTCGASEIELTKADFDWKLVKPFEEEANRASVGKLLADLENARIAQVATTQPEKGKYGIETPRASFSYIEAEKAPLGIIVGDDAGEGFVYVKRTDTPSIFKVSSDVLKALSTPAFKLRTLDMQRMTIANIVTLEITRGQDKFTLARTEEAGDEAWKLTQPVEAAANKALMKDIALYLATTKAVDILADSPPDLAVYGLDQPAARVDFNMTSETVKAKSILVGKIEEGGKRYAMLDDGKFVFTLAAGFSRDIFDEFKDPAVFSFKTSDATQLEVASGDKKVVLSKADNIWRVDAPAGRSVAQSSLWSELSRLSVLVTSKFVAYKTGDLPKYGLDKPVAVLRVVMPTGVAALSVGSMALTGHYYSTSSTSEGVFLLTPGDLASILDPEKMLEPVEAEDTAPVPAPETPAELEAPQETTEGVKSLSE